MPGGGFPAEHAMKKNNIFSFCQDLLGKFKPSKNPLSSRFFTDLRFEKIESLVGSTVSDYLLKLKTEEFILPIVKFKNIKDL